MPRKTKEPIEEKEEEQKKSTSKRKTSTTKKTTTKKETKAAKKEPTVAKRVSSKKKPVVAKKVSAKKEPVSAKKASDTKKSTTAKKSVAKKTSSKKVAKTEENAIKIVPEESSKKSTKKKVAEPEEKNKTAVKVAKSTRAKNTSDKTTKETKATKATKTTKTKKATNSKKSDKLKVEDVNKTVVKSKRGRKPKKVVNSEEVSLLEDNVSSTAIPMEVEYYDLPYKYNETVVKVLYQNPTTLFVYWEISDSDIENYKRIYGENFFETTDPILIVYNDTMNYKFEIVINDFANSWYFNINDIKCDYRVELGRRPKNNNNDYIYITSSNTIESPNNRILFSTNEDNSVYFKNIKNNKYRKIQLQQILSQLNLKNKKFGFPFIKDLPDLYKNIFGLENMSEFDTLSNPSSGGNPSSGSLSSRFN